MKTVMVRYKVRPEAGAENERLVGQVFAQLARDKPAGLRYQVFKLGDGVSFVHVASSEGGGANPLTALETFNAFTAGIQERCVEAPVSVQMEVVGAFNGLN